MPRIAWGVVVFFACGGSPPPPAPALTPLAPSAGAAPRDAAPAITPPAPSAGAAPRDAAPRDAAPRDAAPRDAAPAPATVPRVGSGPSGCLTPDEVTAAQQRIAAGNEAAFARAVAAAGLAIEVLPIHTWPANEMRPPPANPIVKRSISGRDVTLVLLGTIGGCRLPTADQHPFGRAADTVYRLERDVTHAQVEVSACPRTTCPQPTLVCGGAVRITGAGFELPPGTRYAGARTIAYREEHLDVRFDHGIGIPCMAPELPP